MNNQFWRWICGVSLIGLTSLAFADDRESRALLIGIGDYSGTGLDSLKGPVNDVELMRTLLRTRFAVPDENIVTLVNDQATHTKVQAAFVELAQRVKPGAFVYIHYAGHGSYAEDKFERSGQDETWVTYGARSKQHEGLDNRDVLDKEIRQWLAPLYAKTKDLVFVSDSCHSATVSRGLSTTGVRAARPDPRPHPLISQPFEYPASRPGIRIGAARDIESAVEIDVDHGGQCRDGSKCQGIFTWYWAQALQQSKPGDRWEDLFKRAYTLVTVQRGVSQRPQMEGHGETTVFGGSFAVLKTTLSVTAVDSTSRTVKLTAGQINGVTKGSVYRLFDSEAPDRDDLPAVEVTAVQPFVSDGIIRAGNFKVGDLVVESTHAYLLEPFRLYVSGDFVQDSDKALLSSIQTSLKSLQGFDLTDDIGRADWLVYLLRPTKEGDRYVDPYKVGSLPRSSPDQSPEAWVVSPQGKLLHDRMRISLKNLDNGIAVLKENLATFARATEIKRLESRGGSASVSVAASVWRTNPACRKDCLYLPKDERQQTPYGKIGTYTLSEVTPPLKRGDLVTFALSNQSQDRKPWYTYVLNIGPDGSIKTIFPSRYDNREEAVLKAEENRDLVKEAVLLLDAPGAEVIKVITTKAPIEARLFENPGYLASRGQNMNPLERLLTATMSTRAKQETYEASEWGTTQAEFQVGE